MRCVVNIDPITYAQVFAVKYHGNQLYGVLPYTHHLEHVYNILISFGEDRPEMLCAAWLHDVVEDTDAKVRDVAESFGDETARLVEAVTSEPGTNRKIRNALTYPKIRKAGSDAIKLKLADRLANMRSGGKSLKMYIDEYPDFKHGLYVNDEPDASIHQMWVYLDELAGVSLYQEQK